jgi:hypothetical protein
MIQYSLSVILLSLLLATASTSQNKGFGIGIMIGEPTGLSVKNWLSGRTAVDGAIAWSFVKESSFHVHGDFLLHSFDAIETKEPLYFYYGVGGRIKASKNDPSRVGVRGVAGVGYLLEAAPVDFFLEVAPIFDLTPATEISINAGIGGRYFLP